MKTVTVSLVCAFVAVSALAGDWHTYHGNFGLTGVSADAFPNEPETLWTVRIGEQLSSPVVGGDGGLFCIADGSMITALESTGTARWGRSLQTTNATGNVREEEITAPPLYANAQLLVVATDNGNVYGLSPQDGAQRWLYAAGGSIQGTPNYVPGTDSQPDRVVVMMQDDGTLHVLRADNGHRLWISDPMDRSDGHVAVAGGYAVLGNCAAALFAVDMNSGTKPITIPVGDGCEMAGGVAVDGSRAYAGNRSGSVVCADLQQKTLNWANTNGVGGLFTTPAVAGKHVVFCSADGVVYGVDSGSGKSLWSFATEGMEPLSPIIVGDGVVAAADGVLYGLSLTNGTLCWKLAVSDEITLPAIIDGRIVVGTDDGRLTAYGVGSDE